MSPASGSTEGGTLITIDGVGFDPYKQQTKVTAPHSPVLSFVLLLSLCYVSDGVVLLSLCTSLCVAPVLVCVWKGC